MKREGRQHGTVRTHCIRPSTTLSPVVTLPRKAKSLNGAPPTAGVFTRVPSKPTTNSKFTGKWDCHLHPSSKAKGKSKGSSKLRSSLKLDGLSSSKVLDELHEYAHCDEEEDEVDYDDNGCCDLDERPRRSNLSTGHQNEIKGWKCGLE